MNERMINFMKKIVVVIPDPCKIKETSQFLRQNNNFKKIKTSE